MENQSEEKESIQLLPEKDFEELPLTKKITAWVINVGRIIIIVTELIAFSVFIGRIKLDRELTDLTNDLENQLIILQNARDFEGNFRDLQERLKIIGDLRQKQVPANQVLSLFPALLPSDTKLTGLTFQPETNEINLIAETNSATGFAQTIQNLNSSPQIEEIALTSGRFSAKEGTYNFSLAIKFAEAGVSNTKSQAPITK